MLCANSTKLRSDILYALSKPIQILLQDFRILPKDCVADATQQLGFLIYFVLFHMQHYFHLSNID